MQIIFGNELFTINVAMQNSQDAAFYALWSAEMCAQHVVRVSAQIGYMNGSQPVIEQVLELPAPVFNPYSGSNHVPKLNSQTKILGEALNLASLLQQFIDNQSKLVWVTVQHDLNNGAAVTDFTATAYYDEQGCPKLVSQITRV